MNRREFDEQGLIPKAIDGDSHACTEIVSHYRQAVISYISTIVPCPEDAEDLCQETFQKCFRYLPTYNVHYAFSTWLYTIAQNTALDFIRKKRITSAPLSDINREDSHRSAASTVPSPEESLINVQAIENLIKSIQNLPGIYRKVAELRFIHEYPLEEISKELNLPLNTVKTRVSRSKKILNDIWKS